MFSDALLLPRVRPSTRALVPPPSPPARAFLPALPGPAVQHGGSPTPRPERRRVTLADVGREFVSYRDHWPFAALAVGIAGWLLASGPGRADAVWAMVGLLMFIPQEYFTHSLLLHRPIPRTQRRYDLLYRLHYGHHDHPRRHDLMYMPLWLTLPMMAANLLLLWAATPMIGAAPRAFWAAFAGLAASYLLFEWLHLLCHVPWLPRGGIWRRMRSQHLLHHHADETRGFAIAPWSVTLDHLFGTRAPAEPDAGMAIARSPSCRHLGLPSDHPWLLAARRRFASASNGDLTGSRLWPRTVERSATNASPSTGEL